MSKNILFLLIINVIYFLSYSWMSSTTNEIESSYKRLFEQSESVKEFLSQYQISINNQFKVDSLPFDREINTLRYNSSMIDGLVSRPDIDNLFYYFILIVFGNIVITIVLYRKFKIGDIKKRAD